VDKLLKRARELRDKDMTYAAIGTATGVPWHKIYRVLNAEKIRISSAKYRATHKEKIRTNNAEYRASHIEELREKNKRYCVEHADKRHAYRMAHKEEIDAYNAAYHIEHLDSLRAYGKEYEKAHKESRAEYTKEHLVEHAARQNLRRAVLAGATVGNLAEIKEIYRISKEEPRVRCYLCGELIPIGHRHVDHIVPLSKGGKHRPSNLAVACDVCNLSKHTKMPGDIGLLL